MKRICCLLLCIVLIASFSSLAWASGSVPDAVMKAKDSVVRILAKYPDGYATGSGFVVKSSDSETLVVTNYHVVEGSPLSISVWLGEEETMSASILVSSDQKDMCVLQLANPVSIKPVTLSSDGAKQGEAVYAVGFPAAADYLSDKEAHASTDSTITDGIIGAVREITVSAHGTPTSVLQINAAINHGNSGGPLFNAKGEVVGITTYGINDSQGIFGAINVDELQAFLASNAISVETAKVGQNGTLYVVLAAIVLLAATTAITIFAMKKKKKHAQPTEQKPISLRDYINAHPDGIGSEQATSLLLPLALKLRDLHNDGGTHLQISPDSVMVSNSGAFLNSPADSEANRYSSGFASPEIYKGSGAGVLSDIYSFCAVLSYAATGKQPENALSRTVPAAPAEADCSEEIKCDDPFEALLEKGMALDPEQRFSNMQELILKLSPFHKTAFSLDEPATNNTISEADAKGMTPRKRKISTAATIAIAAVLLVVILAGGYFGSYMLACSAAGKHEYEKAEKYLLIPELTKLHNGRLPVYIDAGKLFAGRNYDAAKTKFTSISGYLDSDELSVECDYRRAAQLADASRFDEAIELYTALESEGYKDAELKVSETTYRKGMYLLYEQGDYKSAVNLFSKLAKTGYDDAADMKKEAQYMWALSLIEQEDFIEAYNMLTDIQNYSDVNETLSTLKEILYLKGQDLYHAGKYTAAKQYFDCLLNYKDTSKYLTLINVHQKGTLSFHVYSYDISDLLNMFYFEDTADLLLHNHYVAKAFLKGTWKGDGYYFTMEEDGHINYNLPYIIYGDFYRIEDGFFLLYKENDEENTKNLFLFSAITPDCVEVYCFQNGKTYTLFRQ